jgi:hypothetical protein
MPTQRLATHPVDRLARVESVLGQHRRMQGHRDRDVRHIAAGCRPAGHRLVVPTCVVAGDATQGLRQEREFIHRRQRRERHVPDAGLTEQPVRKPFAMHHGTPRRHLLDHIVDTEYRDRHVGGGGRVTLKQAQRLLGGSAAARLELPVHRTTCSGREGARQVAGQSPVLVRHADAGRR